MDFSRASNVFDLYIDWERRLAREIPFLERRLTGAGARNVADVACGSGQHAVALAKLGFQVTGIDPDERLLDQARATARTAGVAIDWIEASFSELGAIAERGGLLHDGIVCVGNSLALIDGEALPGAFENLAALLSPGGVLVIHTINFPMLASRDEDPWGPVRVLDDGSLLLKGFVPRGDDPWDGLFVAVAPTGDGGWTRSTHRFSLHPHARSAVEENGRGAGLEIEEVAGGFSGESPDQPRSADLVYVFRKI